MKTVSKIFVGANTVKVFGTCVLQGRTHYLIKKERNIAPELDTSGTKRWIDAGTVTVVEAK